MEKVYYYFFLSIVLQLYFLEAFIATNINTDESALLALKARVTLDSSHPMTQNWTSQASVCDWIGVTCGSRHHRVTALNVSNMNIRGTIPQQLGNLSFLVSLDMRNNSLLGDLPQDLFRLRRLKYMNLRNNSLNGTIPPDIVNLERLQFLSLSLNNLQGTIPTKIGDLRNLQKLQLRGNKIVGSIPHTISNMSSLYHLNLDSNNLTGVIPREIGNLHKLERLYLGGNELSGAIPEVLFNISTLKEVDLAYNNLSGSLPCYWQTNLQILHLHVNNIGGVIPTSISNSSNLKELLLFHNKFSGQIPNSLGDLRQLEDLELFQNNLSSSPHDQSIFTSLTNCRSLRLIAFNENPLNDELPDSIGNLSTSLEQFYLYDSEISGKIPLGIGNLTNLIMLNLFGNDLTGSMPATLCDLQNIQRLDLHNNKLSGTIPECLCKLPGLEGVFLYENQISGPIPYCIGNVTSLRYIYLESNRLTTNIPMSIWSLKDVLELDLSDNSLVGSLNPNFGNLIAITMLNLSRNKLSGSIPATVGKLQKLNYLSLAYNELEGSIPKSLGNMISLETLDLSNNIISGVIPKSLEALKYLEDFNVSFNRLEGEIPGLNFTSQSFMGNKELCGGLLFRPCKAKFFHQSRKSKFLLIILVPLAISLMGLCLIVVFVLKRRGNRNVPTQVESLLENITPARISYNEIERATQGFDQCNLLGSGGFGSVYKGRFENGMVLAIKVFSLQFEGAFKSFDRECEILRNLRHINLIKVITSCTNMDFKALLLEYMPNGSLEEWLYSDDNFFLDINQRLDIMIDVASALDYLHHGYSTVVVHCDLKPSNVLLDERLVGHVSDFGLAKLLGEGETKAHTTTLATMGYIAPEYGSTGLVSTSCDVYSYGIMLMETFTRKRPQDEMFLQENLNMRSWVCNSLAAAAVADIVDSTLVEPEETGFNKMLHCVSSILELALDCTVESPSERLNMKVILANIKDIKLEFLCK